MTLAPEARRRELKLASGDLVQAVGGIAAAAGVVSLSKSQVHRCSSVNDADNFFNAGDIAELERRAPRAFVTIALAKLAGGVFIQLPEPFDGSEGLACQVMGLAQELGEVSARVADGLADGIVRPREAAAIELELDQLIEKAAQTRAVVRGIQGKPALDADALKQRNGSAGENSLPERAAEHSHDARGPPHAH